MLRRRWFGGTKMFLADENMTLPSMMISPESAFQAPAMHRSRVVFSQPLGPINSIISSCGDIDADVVNRQ